METTDLNALERARATLADKEASLARCRDNLAKLEREAEELRTVVKWLDALDKGEAPKSSTRVTKASQAADFALAQFEKVGPTVISDLQAAYEGAGNTLPGKTETERRNNLSGYLNRDARVSYYKEHGRWWYSDRAYPGPAVAVAVGQASAQGVAGQTVLRQAFAGGGDPIPLDTWKNNK